METVKSILGCPMLSCICLLWSLRETVRCPQASVYEVKKQWMSYCKRHDIPLLATMAVYKHTYKSVTADAMKPFHLHLYHVQFHWLICLFIYRLFNRGFTEISAFRKRSVRISARTSDILAGGFHSLPQYLQANTEIVLRLCQDNFLPNPFQFIYHISMGHNGSVDMASSYGLDGRGKRFFSFPQCSDRLWGRPSLLPNGYRGLFLRE
jgi:hypothetical protein